MITKLGRPYAQSLLDSLGSTGAATAALEQLQAVHSAMEQVPALRHMAANPAIPIEVKQRTLGEIADSLGLGQAVRRFLELLLENYRLVDLGEIVESFEGLLNRKLGVVQASVVTATELTDEQRQSLQSTLESVAGSKVELETSVAEDLLGGFVATIGSQRYDTSVKGHLDRMVKEIAAG